MFKKLKIGIITEANTSPTGTDYYQKNLTNELNLLGCDVYLITPWKVEDTGFKNIKQVILPWTIIKIPFIGRLTWYLSLYFRLPKYRFDVINSSWYGMMNLLPWDIYRKTLKVTTIADATLENKKYRNGSISMWMLIKVLQPPHIRFNDVILTVSENSKRMLHHFKRIPMNRIGVVYHGVSPEFSKRPDRKTIEIVRKRYSLPRKFLFNAGILKNSKNILNIIRSFALVSIKHPDIHLVFSGRLNKDDPSEFERSVLKELDGLDVSVREKIMFLNFVSYADLKSIYYLSEVFVMPSLEEGFGMPLLEAMSCGIPVVTSDRSAMPEVVGDDALKCNPNDVKDIAGAIDRILSDNRLRRRLSVAGVKRSKRFTWRICGEKTYRFYLSEFNKKMMKI